MAFPSQAFCFLSSPPFFSDHHLVSSFCYCTVFPGLILMSLAGICSSPETKTRPALGKYVYFSFPCAHISRLRVGIYFLSLLLPQHTQRSIPSVIILTNFLFVGDGINPSCSGSAEPKQGQVLFQNSEQICKIAAEKNFFTGY